MAEISGLVTNLIAVLFVAGCVDVAVTAGEIDSVTDASELMTDLQTVTYLIEIPDEEVGTSPSPRAKRPPPPAEQDEKDSIKIRFTLLEYTSRDTGQDLHDSITGQVSSVLQNELSNFAGVELDAFRTPGEDLRVDLTISFAGDSRATVYDILLQLVEVNGTIGTIKVDGLKVRDKFGRMSAYTHCNVTDDPCPPGANCVGDGSSCSATCSLNDAYCQNGGTCQKNGPYISCSCPERVSGERCEERELFLSDTARVALIAVAVFVSLLILLILLFCLIRKCQPCTKPTRELYGVENIVALHSIGDEAGPVGGVAIQTDDSFLLNLSYANGVPPKAGYSHKIMQTNESFLLARSQNPKVAQVKAQARLPQSQNGSPATSENSNGSRESKPTPPGSTSRDQPEKHSNINAEATQTGGSLPRKIIKV